MRTKFTVDGREEKCMRRQSARDDRLRYQRSIRFDPFPDALWKWLARQVVLGLWSDKITLPACVVISPSKSDKIKVVELVAISSELHQLSPTMPRKGTRQALKRKLRVPLCIYKFAKPKGTILRPAMQRIYIGTVTVGRVRSMKSENGGKIKLRKRASWEELRSHYIVPSCCRLVMLWRANWCARILMLLRKKMICGRPKVVKQVLLQWHADRTTRATLINSERGVVLL